MKKMILLRLHLVPHIKLLSYKYYFKEIFASFLSITTNRKKCKITDQSIFCSNLAYKTSDDTLNII